MPDPTKPITPEATPTPADATPAAPTPSNTGPAEKPRRGAEIVRDVIPHGGPGPTRGSRTVSGVPHDDEGRIGTGLAKLSWRSRMRWLDDGGR